MSTRLPQLLLIGLTLAACAGCATAASKRDAWVVQQIHDYNHPYAAQHAELDTKMATMATGAYAFYRGTDHIFYQDMKTLPGSLWTSPQTGYTWLGGDTHLGNFDAARDSSGKAVFKVADFDEGHLGQYVWDLRRLAASMVLAGRDNGLSDSDIGDAIDTMVGAYLDKIADFRGSDAEESFQLSKRNTSGAVAKIIDSADGKSRSSLLSKYTVVNGGKRQFQNLDNLVAVDAGTASAVAAAMNGYIGSIAASKRYAASYYSIKDVRQKLGSGTGSLGRLRLYVLIEGPSASTSDDVILEWKQEAASVVAVAAPSQMPASTYDNNEGARVARTAKAQTIDADVLVGYASVDGTPFYVHEKSPFQQDLDPTALDSAGKLATAATYLGQALASAHALADQDYDPNVVPYSIDKQIDQAASSKSGLKSELRQFAFDYAAQVQLDWQSFVAAYKAGTPLY
ncbi:DUF2252 family protein [Xanthomonas sontii]|uniref:DUF2252 domain-containing protein n=1 Tax=Xanthomonas sontii TaxID=2650745 RepID=UPI0011E492C6|nr:DUF2252 family protein [Xanthomonas sontii]MDQ7760180.1 DUF2252 family protein [Xanthomonas sontii]UZK05982.1 DUF2252 family protein [Xanthomonas sontii]